jgi:hypothetical protein
MAELIAGPPTGQKVKGLNLNMANEIFTVIVTNKKATPPPLLRELVTQTIITQHILVGFSDFHLCNIVL